MGDQRKVCTPSQAARQGSIVVGVTSRFNGRSQALMFRISLTPQFFSVCNQPPRSTQSSVPLLVGTVRASESRDVNRHTVRCTSPISVIWQYKLVSG